jgi:hypothetical protein
MPHGVSLVRAPSTLVAIGRVDTLSTTPFITGDLLPGQSGSPIPKNLVVSAMCARLYANPPACHEMVNEDDHRDDKQKMNQPSGNMKCKESREP